MNEPAPRRGDSRELGETAGTEVGASIVVGRAEGALDDLLDWDLLCEAGDGSLEMKLHCSSSRSQTLHPGPFDSSHYNTLARV